MRRAKSNRRRVRRVGADDAIVTVRVPAPEPDPLLLAYERRHKPLPSRDLIREAMAAADAASIPPCPTGRCHTCDRKITGERIYCGPCLAARL